MTEIGFHLDPTILARAKNRSIGGVLAPMACGEEERHGGRIRTVPTAPRAKITRGKRVSRSIRTRTTEQSAE
jgi:hypothetical protein